MYNYIALQGERTMVKEIATQEMKFIIYVQVASMVALSYSYIRDPPVIADNSVNAEHPSWRMK